MTTCRSRHGELQSKSVWLDSSGIAGSIHAQTSSRGFYAWPRAALGGDRLAVASEETWYCALPWPRPMHLYAWPQGSTRIRSSLYK